VTNNISSLQTNKIKRNKHTWIDNKRLHLRLACPRFSLSSYFSPPFNFIFSYLTTFPNRYFYFPKTPVGILVPRSSMSVRGLKSSCGSYGRHLSDSQFSITPRFSLGLPFCYGQGSRSTKRVFRRRCTTFYFPMVSFVRSRAHENQPRNLRACPSDQSTPRKRIVAVWT